jgi:hypothetical protein
MLELRADEHCGCANSEKLYGDCCMPRDQAANRIGESLRFFWLTGGVREPPWIVVDYIRSGKELPSLAALVTAFSSVMISLMVMLELVISLFSGRSSLN